MYKREVRKRVSATLSYECEAIKGLARSVDRRFWHAVELLRERAGRIIVTGVGKSGYVAMKMAATLTSLGHPSHFLNPLDALHGDAGMVGRGDVIVAISSSGTSRELVRLLKHLKKELGVAVITITTARTSPLVKLSDAVIVFSIRNEGCPVGLAPMASTTASMVLGDLLASALTSPESFRERDFARLHPAGSLGFSLRRVSEVMTKGRGLPAISADAPFGKALFEIDRKRCGIVGVTAGGQLVGAVTDGDVRRILLIHKNPHAISTSKLMKRNPKTISESATLQDALAKMERNKITSLFVLGDDGRYIGFIHMHDIVEDIV